MVDYELVGSINRNIRENVGEGLNALFHVEISKMITDLELKLYELKNKEDDYSIEKYDLLCVQYCNVFEILCTNEFSRKSGPSELFKSYDRYIISLHNAILERDPETDFTVVYQNIHKAYEMFCSNDKTSETK